jgi:purine-nucleoside phosphorylase
LATGKLHIFTAIQAEARAIRPILPEGVGLTVIGILAVHLPQEIDAGAIVMAGFAGALDPGLGIGDIVRDEPAGSIHTSNQIVATVAEKAALFGSTGATAVDMENAIVRKFAERLGVPFFGIRAISDRADEAVDPLVLQFIDETGRLRPGAIAKGLIRKPAIIPSLNRLRINSAIAGRALAGAVAAFLKEHGELLT